MQLLAFIQLTTHQKGESAPIQTIYDFTDCGLATFSDKDAKCLCCNRASYIVKIIHCLLAENRNVGFSFAFEFGSQDLEILINSLLMQSESLQLEILQLINEHLDIARLAKIPQSVLIIVFQINR